MDNKLLLNSIDIDKIIGVIAAQINHDYSGKKEPIIILGTLTGSYHFISDLTRKLVFDHEIEFIKLNSYRNNQQSHIEVQYFPNPEKLKGKHILVVEDIVDTSKTIQFILQSIKESTIIESVNVCSLLVRENSKHNCTYFGKIVEDHKHVFGYGFDSNEIQRNLPSIYYFTKN